MSPSCVITNPETNEKIGVGGYDSMFAVLAIVDPELTRTVPPKFTAYQGFDALFHSLEGYISCVSNPMSDMVQRTAIEKIGNISGSGEFVVYTELRDSEGFAVYLSSVYNYQIQPEIETGFYTLVTVASLDDVRACNLATKQEAQTAPQPIDEYDDTSDSEGE